MNLKGNAMAQPTPDAKDGFGWWHTPSALISVVGGLVTGFIGGSLFQGNFAISFAVTFLAATAIIYLLTWRLARNRFQLRSWCAANGWQFQPVGDPLESGALQHVAELNKSHLYWKDSKSQNSMSKRVGDRGVVVLEKYYYTTDSDGHQTKHQTTFLLLDCAVSSPEIILHGHHVVDKLNLPGGLRTVEFESAAFNKKWTVKARDPKAAFDRFDQAVLEYLESVGHPLAVEFAGRLLIIRHKATTLASRLNVLRFVEKFTSVVPDDLMAPIDLLPAN